MTEPTDQLPRLRRPVRRRPRHLQRLGIGAVVALVAVTVGALVTNSPLEAATSGTGVAVDRGGDGGTPDSGVPTDGTIPSPNPLGAIDGGLGGTGLDLGTGGGAAVGGPGTVSFGEKVAGADAPAEGAAPSETTVIVHPTLQLLAFGGQIGMPLVCSLAIGGAGPALSAPGVSAAVGQILSACVAGANQGADSLRALDAQLTALAAINPAVGPALDQLATALEAASTADAPFVTYLLQISALIRFFRG